MLARLPVIPKPCVPAHFTARAPLVQMIHKTDAQFSVMPLLGTIMQQTASGSTSTVGSMIAKPQWQASCTSIGDLG